MNKNYEMSSIRGCDTVVKASHPNVNPAEPLDISETYSYNNYSSKDEHKQIKDTKVLITPSLENEPIKNFMKKNHKCLSNLTQEMSITLRQSIACLDEIFMKARQCLSEMEENDRRYHFAKEKKLDIKVSCATTLSDILSNDSSIQDEDFEPLETIEIEEQPEIALEAEDFICNSLGKLNEICNNVKDKLICEEGSEVKVSQTNCKRIKSSMLEEKAKFKKKLRTLKSPSSKELEQMRQIRRMEMQREVLSAKDSYTNKVIKLKSNASIKSNVSHHSNKHKNMLMKSESKNKSICKCHDSNCKCGIEVKSHGKDLPLHSKMQWIRKADEQHNNRPEFLDVLDDIKDKDVERFQSEYPRKDHLLPMQRKCVQDTLIYRLVFDRSLNIWDFLLYNQFSHLTNLKKVEAPMSNKNLISSSKKSITLDRKSTKDIHNYKSRSIVRDNPSCHVMIKKSKHTSKKALNSRSQKEMLMPKRHIYTILPVEVAYDKEKSSKTYQNMVKKMLKPYLIDPELERNDVYTVMPVSVYFENAKHTLYPYLCDYSKNNPTYGTPEQEKGTYLHERNQCNMQLCKKCEKDVMMGKPMTQKNKMMWQNKYKKTPAENIVKTTKSNNYQRRLILPDNAVNPLPQGKINDHPNVKIDRNKYISPYAERRTVKKPLNTIQEQPHDISSAVSNIEAKLVEILENPVKDKLKAFTSVEEDITKILNTIQKHHKMGKNPNLALTKQEIPTKDNESPKIDMHQHEQKIYSSSTPSVIAEVSTETEKLDKASKNTLDEIESKIMELDNDDLDIQLNNNDEITYNSENYSRTDTIELEKRGADESLFIIKEENSESSEINQKAEDYFTDYKKTNMELTKKDNIDIWEKFKEDLGNVKQEEAKLRQLTQNLALNNNTYSSQDSYNQNQNNYIENNYNYIGCKQENIRVTCEVVVKAIPDQRSVIIQELDNVKEAKKSHTNINKKHSNSSSKNSIKKQKRIETKEIAVSAPNLISNKSEGTEIGKRSLFEMNKAHMKNHHTQMSCVNLKSTETQMSTGCLQEYLLPDFAMVKPIVEIMKNVDQHVSCPEIKEVIHIILNKDNDKANEQNKVGKITEVKEEGHNVQYPDKLGTEEMDKKVPEVIIPLTKAKPSKQNKPKPTNKMLKCSTPPGVVSDIAGLKKSATVITKSDADNDSETRKCKNKFYKTEQKTQLPLSKLKQRSRSFNSNSNLTNVAKEKVIIEQNIGESKLKPKANKKQQKSTSSLQNLKELATFEGVHGGTTEQVYFHTEAKVITPIAKQEQVNTQQHKNGEQSATQVTKTDSCLCKKKCAKNKESESNPDMLTFLDDLKKISFDNIAISKYMRRKYRISYPVDISVEEHYVEIIESVLITSSIPRFLKNISVVSYADHVSLPRSSTSSVEKTNKDIITLLNNEDNLDLLSNTHSSEVVFNEILDKESKKEDLNILPSNESNISAKKVSKTVQKIEQAELHLEKIGLDNTKFRCVYVQTDVYSKHLEVMLKWPQIKQPLFVSRGCLISTFSQDLPKVILTLNEQANPHQLLSNKENKSTLIIQMSNMDNYEELINASISNRATPKILPLMYGILFSVVYLGLNFNFTCD